MRYICVYKIPAVLLRFCEFFEKAGYSSFLVGGCIRDMILARVVVDYDFATDALPAEVQNIFSRTIPTGIQHGTVTVLFEENEFQVTTYRKERGYSDCRHPDEVQFSSSIVEDLSRRDFTMNALAYDTSSCTLIDEYEGIQDIEDKVVRTVGDPQERFSEDALRMMRACRFACQLGFSIEKHTFSAIQDLCANIQKISAERIREEWIKILQSEQPSKGVAILKKAGLLQYFLPQLENTVGITQNKYHKYDVYEHSIQTLEKIVSKDYRIRMAALFHDIAKPQTKEYHEEKKDFTFYGHESVGASMVKSLMKNLKFSNEDVYFVTHLVQNHMFHYTPEWTDGAVRKFITRVGMEYLEPLFDLRQADRGASGFLEEEKDVLLEEFRVRIQDVLDKGSAFCIANLDITGNDIMSHHQIPPGKVIGAILRYLLDKVQEDPKCNKKEILLHLSQKYLNTNI